MAHNYYRERYGPNGRWPLLYVSDRAVGINRYRAALMEFRCQFNLRCVGGVVLL